MLVYGDRSEQAAPQDRLRQIDRKLREASATPGLERRSALRDALIDVGRVLQGVADAQFMIRRDQPPVPIRPPSPRHLPWRFSA